MEDGSYKYDIDDTNFIKKILNKFSKAKNQKLLTSGNVRVKYTSESISSMWKKTAFKAAVYQKLEKLTNLFVKTKQTVKNSYEAQIIGEISNTDKSAESKIIADTKLSDVAPIIPKAVSKTIKYNTEASVEEQKDE